jgi:phosphoribosyl-ATP pyrophosphohydrolase
MSGPGYHLQRIAKGELGEASKIAEEAQEFVDAVAQGVDIMALMELSDLYGAMRAYLKNHHPSLSMDDLSRMSQVTERAFLNGHRD